MDLPERRGQLLQLCTLPAAIQAFDGDELSTFRVRRHEGIIAAGRTEKTAMAKAVFLYWSRAIRPKPYPDTNLTLYRLGGANRPNAAPSVLFGNL